MKRLLVGLGFLTLLVPVLSGCGQKYSTGCKKAADLTAPWNGLNVPVDDGRVCESDAQHVKMELIGSSKPKAAASMEQALTSAGFAKESCPSYCVYAKDTQRVQVIVGDIAGKWTTVAMIMSTGKAKAAAADPGNDNKKTDAPPPTTAGGASSIDGIPECASYFSKLLACPPNKGPVSRAEEAKIKKRELQEKLDKGTKSGPEIVKRTCETFEKTLKC